MEFQQFFWQSFDPKNVLTVLGKYPALPRKKSASWEYPCLVGPLVTMTDQCIMATVISDEQIKCVSDDI